MVFSQSANVQSAKVKIIKNERKRNFLIATSFFPNYIYSDK